MAMNDFMNKIRRWDNQIAKWITRHFYLIFFEIVLVLVFLIWFINMFGTLDIAFTPNKEQMTFTERTLANQSINSTVMVFLLILNSFWMLFMFNGMLRLRILLKDINYSITRLRQQKREQYKQKPRN